MSKTVQVVTCTVNFVNYSITSTQFIAENTWILSKTTNFPEQLDLWDFGAPVDLFSEMKITKVVMPLRNGLRGSSRQQIRSFQQVLAGWQDILPWKWMKRDEACWRKKRGTNRDWMTNTEYSTNLTNLYSVFCHHT